MSLCLPRPYFVEPIGSMIEKRKSARPAVVWRAAIKLEAAKLTAAKVINVSESGLMFECIAPLELQREYEFMMEVPALQQTSDPHQVLCRVKVLHTILSEGIYRVGVRFVQLADLHRDLIAARISMSKKV